MVVNEQGVAVRLWEPGDDDALLAGFVDAYNRPPWNDAWSLATAAVYLGELRGIPRSATLVAVADSQFVGATTFHARTWQDESEIYIDEFFVAPAAQRRGVGHALMEGIRAFAADAGISDLVLLTDRDVPAFDFYRAHGFREGTRQVFMIG